MTAHGLFFEDLALGVSRERIYRVDEALVAAFAQVSGDRNPVHLDAEYAAATPFKQRVAHGMLGAAFISAVIGMDLPGPGAVYVSQSLRFKRPVNLGDEVSASASVTALDPAKSRATLLTLCRVGGKIVIEGEAEILVPRRPPAPEIRG
jgi:3-hydroxybutyryl-CoA dehydratase